MKNPEPLDRADAETYASWFRALAGGTRVQLVSLLARSGEPMTVGQIVAAVPVGQSTVSAHLKQLAAVGFVLAEDRGTALLDAFTGSTEAAGIWTIQTGIFPENTTSLRLHRRAGFRRVGTRQRIGCDHGRWRDVTLLERRSTVAGT